MLSMQTEVRDTGKVDVKIKLMILPDVENWHIVWCSNTVLENNFAYYDNIGVTIIIDSL